VGIIRIPIDYQDPRALLAEQLRRGGTDPAGPSGNQSNLAH
jgi:hypothetical protein